MIFVKKKLVGFRGFSFGEVMLSSFVFSVGLLALVNLFFSNAQQSRLDIDRIVGAQLAQEGVELVRNIRDNNFANGREAFPSTGATSTNPDRFPGSASRDFCRLSYSDSKFVLHNNFGTINCFNNHNSPEDRFSLDIVGGRYAFQSGVSKYARVITIDPDVPSDPSRVTVTSIVWWGDSSVKPAGVFTGVSADQTDLSQCTIAKKCTYSQSVLESWK